MKYAPALIFMPASVAQLDARPTGEQEVAGSTPASDLTALFANAQVQVLQITFFTRIAWL